MFPTMHVVQTGSINHHDEVGDVHSLQLSGGFLKVRAVLERTASAGLHVATVWLMSAHIIWDCV